MERGKKLNDTYTLIDEIGSGGGGVDLVLLADLDRSVAGGGDSRKYNFQKG